MKSIEENADEYASEAYIVFPQAAVKTAFMAGYKAAQEWISVEDELPENDCRVLSKWKNKKGDDKFGINSYDQFDKKWQYEFDSIIITHWRPIEIN